MGNEVLDFSRTKIKKSFGRKNQSNFIKIQKEPTTGNNSDFPSYDLKSLFTKLNPKKKAASKLIPAKQIQKDYSFELFGKNPKKEEITVLTKKRKGTSDINEGPAAKVLRISQKTFKEKKAFSEAIPNESSKNNDLKNEKSKEKKKKFKNQHDKILETVSNESPENSDLKNGRSKEKKKKYKNQQHDRILETVSNESLENSDWKNVKSKEKKKIFKNLQHDRTLETVSNEGSENNDSKNAVSKEEKQKLKNQQQDRSLQRSRSKIIKQRSKDEKARLNRTLFVGNLPVNVTRKVLDKLFSGYGTIESVRLRGVIPMKQHMPKKIAEIKRSFHSGLQSRKGFVVFKNEDQAKNALSLNGQVIDDHHIIVNRAFSTEDKKTYDNKRSIFIGNLPFSVEDETVWNSFAQFGDVEAVRVIRDKTTGAGKGFGYVLFQNTEAKESALNKESVEIEGRKVRIKDVEGGKKYNPSPKRNFAKSRALSLKHKSDNANSRKSVKKIMKREKLHYEKKKVANTFKKYF